MSSEATQTAPPDLRATLAAAGIELSGDTAWPVFKDDPVGRHTPSVASPDSQPVAISSAHFNVDPQTGDITSRGYGLVVLRDGELRVKPLLKICDDRTVLKATLFHRDFQGAEVTPERLSEMLQRMAVSAPLEQNAVAEALAKARKTKAAVPEVAVALGSLPEEGHDGFFEPAVQLAEPSQEKYGAEADKQGQVDHRERSTLRLVSQGEFLGRIVPLVPGTEGRDVFGNVIPAPEVKSAQIVAGEGVDVSDDGLSFYAAIPGNLTFEDGHLKVSDILKVEGDVDFNTGNIRLERGTIYVTGSVQDGFILETPGDVIVKDSIYAANVTAGGDITVDGGLFTCGAGNAAAGGTITAQFIVGARLEAEKDVVATHNISNSNVRAGGKVLCTKGKGVIVGGVVKAMGGVECRDAGSEFGVRTVFFLGPEDISDERKELLAKRKKIRRVIDQIDAALGKAPPAEILRRTPPEKRRQVAQLLKIRIGGQNDLKEIEGMLEAERAKAMQLARASLRVLSKVYPGVMVKAFGHVHTFETLHNACTIRFNPETSVFEIT